MVKAKKAIILLLLAIVSVFGVAGCNEGETPTGQEPVGELYTLQKAYDNGYITKTDLMSIAYYHNSGSGLNEEIMRQDYKPLPKVPEVLDSTTELKIKTTSAIELSQYIDDVEVSGFTISEYCGTYGDCVAIMLKDIYRGYAAVAWVNEIAGINICYGDGNRILIWKESKNDKGTSIVPENCEAVVETTLYSGADRCNDFIAICNSLDEFKEKCLRNGYEFFEDNDQINNYFNTDAGEKIREYTDEYFENNAFIVCAFYKSSWAGQYLIEDVEVTSSKLTLYIRYPRNNTVNAVINSVFLIAGVDKSFVSDVTDLEYVLR